MQLKLEAHWTLLLTLTWPRHMCPNECLKLTDRQALNALMVRYAESVQTRSRGEYTDGRL